MLPQIHTQYRLRINAPTIQPQPTLQYNDDDDEQTLPQQNDYSINSQANKQHIVNKQWNATVHMIHDL
jgi:hypothetical protein